MFSGPLGPLDYVVITAAVISIVILAARAFGPQDDNDE